MSHAKCMRGVIPKTELSDAELERISADYRYAKRRAEKDASAPKPSEYAQRQAAKRRSNAAADRVNAMNNALKRRELLDRQGDYKDISTWAEAMAAPSNADVPGARDSASIKMDTYRGIYSGGFLIDMQQAGLVDYVAARLRDVLDPRKWGKGALDDMIIIELYEQSGDGKGIGRTGSKEAQKIAEIIYKWQEIARADLNRLGANIGKLPGYIVSQSHDMFRISAAGFDKWRAQAERTFGGDRTYESIQFTGDELKDKKLIDEFWSRIYNELSRGDHLKNDEPLGFTGSGNVAKKMSQQRVLHAKTPELWTEYHDQFGASSLMEAVLGGFRKSGGAAGLMDKFGTNPRAQFMGMIHDATQNAILKGIPYDKDRLEGFTMKLWDAVDGTLDVPSSVTVANIGAGVRAWQSAAKLGMAAWSSISDIANAASTMTNDFGDNMFVAALNNIQERLAQITDGGQRKEAAMYMRAGIETVLREIASRVTGSDAHSSKYVNKAMNAYFRLNGLGWMTDAGERAHSVMMATRLAYLSDTALDGLPDEVQRMFRAHDISAAEWDIMRKHTGFDIPGSEEMRVLAADKIREVPLNEMDPLIEFPLEALNIQAKEGLERMQAKAEKLAEKITLYQNVFSKTAAKGFQVNFMKGMRDMVKSLQAAKYSELKAGFGASFKRAANVLEGFTRRDIDLMGQHSNKIDRLKARLEKAKGVEPDTLRQIGEVGEELKGVRESLTEAIDAMQPGADMIPAEKLWARQERLQTRITKLKQTLSKAGEYGQAIADLTEMSQHIAGMQRADYEALLEKQRARVVKDVASGTRTLARQHAKEAAEFAKIIQKNIDSLKVSKDAEPAVLAALGDMQKTLAELQKSIGDWPARLEDQMNAKRELARQKLAVKMQQMYTDRIQHGAVIRGGAREKAMTTGGTQSGTGWGEAIRMIMQFKNYPISFVTQILGRYAQEDRFLRIPGALARRIIADPQGTGSQVAQLIILVTTLGYISGVLKDIMKGMTPRDPTDPRTAAAAFLQGGGAGIYGDYLFARVNRFGGTVGEAAAGPGLGTIFDGVDISLKARDALINRAMGEESDFPDNELFQFFKNNTPGANLFYIRAPLDYLILYNLQEQLSPGSLRRLESRVKSERGQEYLLPPSEYAVGQ